MKFLSKKWLIVLVSIVSAISIIVIILKFTLHINNKNLTPPIDKNMHVNLTINDGLPLNWKDEELKKEIEKYANEIENIHEQEHLNQIARIINQLKEATTYAYDGLDKIIIFIPSDKKGDENQKLCGNWTFKIDQKIGAIHDFFVNHTSNNIYPTWEQLEKITFNSGSPGNITFQEKINRLMITAEKIYFLKATQFSYAKLILNIKHLSKINGIDKNIDLLATNLLTAYYDVKIFLDIEQTMSHEAFKHNEYINGLMNEFITIYEQFPYKISNEDLEEQNEIYYRCNLVFNNENGYLPFTLHTDTESKVTYKKNIYQSVTKNFFHWCCDKAISLKNRFLGVEPSGCE